MKKHKKFWTLCIIIIVAIIIVAGAFFLSHYFKIQKDFNRLETESYDTVFFSMYPTDNYEEGDYLHFRGMQTVRTEYNIPNSKVLVKYMDKVNESQNIVTTVYLGIDPEKTTKEDIVIMIQENPEIMFEIALAHPQINYWLEKSEEECEVILQEYQLLAEWTIGLANARTYFFGGEEWLICNSLNYEGTFLTNPAVSQFLMCNSDFQHPYMLTGDTIEAQIAKMRELISRYRNQPIQYQEADDYDIVFLGDSIIGNYNDSLSVPEVVRALCGAQVYNCGYGGHSAALGEKDDLSVDMIAKAIIEEDISSIPKETQVYEGANAFVTREDKNRKVLFVINYGLNDYFNGYPVTTEDTYDVYSYSGALRVAVKNLKEAYPKCDVLLMTPNFTIQFDYGMGIQSDKGDVLEAYANAVLSLAQEMNVDVLDNYNELPIHADNWKEYLSDGCHLNEQGRFLLGSRIAQKIKQ